MTWSEFKGKDERVGIKLSLEERKLILGDPIHIHEELADLIRFTPTGAPALLTFDHLKDLGGCVETEANHVTDEKVRKKLDAIASKIQNLLETHADEEPPKSLRIKNARCGKLIADKAVQLAERAAMMLIGAEQLGIKDKPVARFPLPWAELGVLLLIAPIDEKVSWGTDDHTNPNSWHQSQRKSRNSQRQLCG
jgi:hypothetical protein